MAGKHSGKSEAPLLDALAEQAVEGPARAAEVALPAPRRLLGGIGLPVAMVSGVVAVGLWGAWVTKNVLADAQLPPMARVQMSAIVGEYVQAQARSNSTPEVVTLETKAFMAEIEKNLKARGAKGQVVLVGEAVLTENVPDITAELRSEVYKKVKRPQVAAAQGDVLGSMRAAMADPSAMAMAAPGPGGSGGAGD
ncbi:MAG: conjugal transfer protein [Sphingomonadaceae bacterium]|nr:conjugal transfer protein [Sphingomonadaceae bacterium]